MSTGSALDDIKARTEGHTPGPWAVEEGNEACAVQAPDGSITWDDHGGEVFRNPADAELIAAAPRLLAALEAVADMHACHDGTYTDWADREWFGRHCLTCRDEWPCDTATAIDEALSGESK